MTKQEIRELRYKVGADPILNIEEIEYIWTLMDKDGALEPIGHIDEVRGEPVWRGECPNCGETAVEYFQHCPECGQKLNWGEEE